MLIARVDLADKSRKVEALREVWLGDNAAVESALGEIKAGASGGKAIILVRSKARESFLADQSQASKVSSAAAVENFIKERFTAENLPAKWSWCLAKDGRAPSGGAVWLLDAQAGGQVDENLAKLKTWSFEPLRCESASLALAGGVVTSLKSAPVGTSVLICDVSELRTGLILLTSQGVVGQASAPVGFDSLAEATQGALGLKFRGSAARLLFNESYDFADAAGKIVEPLSNGVKTALPALGALAPTHLVCSGILIKQAWLAQQLASALGLKNYTPDIAAWATAAGLKIDSGASAELSSPNVLAALSALSAYDSRNPGATAPWHVTLSGTPVAPAPIIPAILFDETPAPAPVVVAKAPEAPSAKVEPAKPAEPAKTPAPAPAKVEPPKAAIAAKPEPAKPAAPAPKPAAVITPPPAKPADNKAAQAPAAKPAPKQNEPAKAAPAPVVKQPAPSSAPKAPAKPEPSKPNTPPSAAPAAPKAPTKAATAAPFPAKKSNNMPIIIGVVVLLLAAVIYFVVDGQKTAKQAEEARKAADAERSKAEADAKRVAAEAAEREAKLKAEQEEQKRMADAKAEQERQEAARQASLATAQQMLNARGSLVVATDPAGASITVGELAPVQSPLNKKDLRLGTYNIVISLPGYDSETRSVEIKPNATVDLGTIKLNRQVGTIELTSSPIGQNYEIRPEGALFVNTDDVRTGRTPATLKDIPIGKYKVTISRAGWPAHVDVISVTKGGVFKSNADFPNGTVTITSEPSGASVSVDGKALGVTPLTLSDVAIGEVRYTLTANLMDDAVVTGTVEGGKNLDLKATLLPTDRIMKISELDERPAVIGEPASPDLSNLEIVNSLTVTINMIVNRDGTPEDIKVEGASGVPGLNRACVVAASKWKFKPGTVKGQTVRTRVAIPFRIAAPTQ